MPTKMISNKKGQIIKALLELILALVVLWTVFSIGKSAIGAVTGDKSAIISFENLADELNSLKDGGSKQVVLSMDKGTAIIGFSENTEEFRCYGCDRSAYSSNPLFYSMNKPLNEPCDDKPCVCLCSKGFSKDPYYGDESELNCAKFSCKTLNQDVLPRILLEEALKKKNIQMLNYPYWENGFYFVRRKNAETPLNGMFPPNDIRKITLWIQKENTEGSFYVAACPFPPCIEEDDISTP